MTIVVSCFSLQQFARADDLVPLVAATGELVGASRSLVLSLALAEGLRVLARRYGCERRPRTASSRPR